MTAGVGESLGGVDKTPTGMSVRNTQSRRVGTASTWASLEGGETDFPLGLGLTGTPFHVGNGPCAESRKWQTYPASPCIPIKVIP